MKIIQPHLSPKYIFVTCSDASNDKKQHLAPITDQLGSVLGSKADFSVLKKHADKLPKDVYSRNCLLLNVNLDSQQILLLFSSWRTDKKLTVQCDLPTSADLETFSSAIDGLCWEAVAILTGSGEVDPENGEVVRRKALIRKICDDLSEEGLYKTIRH